MFVYDDPGKQAEILAGESATLVFVATTKPREAFDLVAQERIWLTLGLYNVLLLSPTPDELRRIKRHSRAHGKRLEIWTLSKGIRVESLILAPDSPNDTINLEITRSLVDAPVPPELQESMNELLPLVASAACRAAEYTPALVEDLRRVVSWLENELVELTTEPEASREDAVYRLLGQLTSLNAGLSRFTSQAFSGTSPILRTECHYWVHSLLGTGTANLALWQLCSFPLRTIGEHRIPERIAAFKNLLVGSAPILESLPASSPFWGSRDFLSDAIRLGPDEDIVPPITCFSGRDGFKSTEEVVSAPLAVISSCNSLRWTLRTITHELSHLVIRGVLGVLLPKSDSSREESLAALGRKPANLFESVQRLLLQTVFCIQDIESGSGRPVSPQEFKEWLFRWRNESEEVMAHVFDFAYFYEDDVDVYVRGIWLSWSALPNIGGRVPEYIIRSLVTIASKDIRRDSPIDLARQRLTDILNELAAPTGQGGEYVRQALQCLDRDWSQLRKRARARLGLAILVRMFLVSTDLRKRVRDDRLAAGKGDPHEGYGFKVGEYETYPFENPLKFVEQYTQARHPSPVESLWLLTTLALNCELPSDLQGNR